MQVLYVGNGNYKHRGARYYDVGRKLFNGFVRGGHNVYLFSDRDIARAANILGVQKLGVRRCNEIFLDTCRNFFPDLIVLGHADIITSRSLEKARSMLPNAKIIQFNVDAIFNPHTIRQILKAVPLCDATFITTAGPVLKRFSHANGVASYIPNPTDASIEWPRCHERSDQENDVFWALRAPRGSFTGDDRIEIPLYLEKSGKIKIEYHGMAGKPDLFNAEYYRRIASAKMGLNISNTRYRGSSAPAAPEDLYLYSSDRLSHYMGSGLLTFSTRDNALGELFVEDKELVFFSSREELLEKIIYFKNHDGERKAIARSGWEKYHGRFNEKLVAKYMVEMAFRLKLSENYAWPTTVY